MDTGLQGILNWFNMKLAKLKTANMPKPMSLAKLIGPSFILLGLGLGSGELILWPYLSSKFGMGLIWAAVLGITFQFFLNMEIERYTLATGESVFVGLARKLSILAPLWFIFSTLIPWMWPGIAASSAQVFSAMIGITYHPFMAILVLLLIGVVLTLGPVLYKTQERFQKSIILIGIPFVFILTIFLASSSDWKSTTQGLAGFGDGFWLFPLGLPIATFLGAFAYAGAGGNLNLSQSLYVKEKGYGMGKFSGRITSIITGKKENISLEGTTFPPTKENIAKFNSWWKRINIEHGIVFWATGAITMILLSLLAYITVFNKGVEVESIQFIIIESHYIAQKTFPLVGSAFLLVAGTMLFFTQFSVLGSTGRIMTENLSLLTGSTSKIPIFFYSFLWIQIVAGIIILLLGFTQPLELVIISAVLNAFTMFVYSGLILWLNLTQLPRQIRPSLPRILFVGAAFIFYGVFSVITIVNIN